MHIMSLLLFLGMAAESHAGDDVTVKPFSIAAGETKTIEVELTQEEKVYTALNFDIILPEGMTITKTVKNNRERYNVTLNADVIDEHQLTMGMIETENHFRLIVACQNLYTFQHSGTLMTIEIQASDMVSTGTFTCQTTDKNLVIDSNNSTWPADTECDVDCHLDVKVSALGYATFSWPRALDFSNTDVEAYIATELTENVLKLTRVTTVPASTGIILKGSANTYHPQTIDTPTDDVADNLLLSTAKEPYTVDADNVFVLSNKKEGKAGFYPAAQGLVIPQYRAFMQSDDENLSRVMFFDDNTSGIRQMENGEWKMENDAVYDLSARKQSAQSKHSTFPKVLIVNGNKVVNK